MKLWPEETSENLVPLDVPQSSIGAPLPTVVADKHTLVVCYLLDEVDPEWDGSTVRIVDGDTTEPLAVLNVKPCTIFTFGPPNDEAIRGHRLAPLGLRPYSAFEVKNSDWIAALERANRVHPYHQARSFDDLRHFVFTFHDSILEFVSRGFEVEVTRGTIREAIVRAAQTL